MTDTDKDLLERAARAAGLNIDANGWMPIDRDRIAVLAINEKGGHTIWSPLTDDGDALRLAVKLREKLGTHIASCFGIGRFDEYRTDPFAATRREIVRAAAALGDGATKSFANDLPEDNYYKTQAESEERGRENSGDAK